MGTQRLAPAHLMQTTWSYPFVPKLHHELSCPAFNARCLAAQVNYVGKAANLYEDAGYELSGAAYVINKHLGATWLWDRVRVSGGAYGGFCDFDPHSGMFSFLSYRDPNLLKTARPGGTWD